MSYLIDGVSIVSPSGTIASYLGTTDPSGWLICDGVQRTSTTNQFATLAPILNTALSITSNSATQVTPPNLTGMFLQGRSSATSGASTTGGNSNVNLSVDNMPSHTHTISGSASTSISGNGFDQNVNTWQGGGEASGAYVGYSTTLTATTALNNLSATPTGSGTSFSILPPYFSVNYIIKI